MLHFGGYNPKKMKATGFPVTFVSLVAVWQVEELGEDGAFDAALMEAFVRETQGCLRKNKKRKREDIWQKT